MIFRVLADTTRTLLPSCPFTGESAKFDAERLVASVSSEEAGAEVVDESEEIVITTPSPPQHIHHRARQHDPQRIYTDDAVATVASASRSRHPHRHFVPSSSPTPSAPELPINDDDVDDSETEEEEEEATFRDDDETSRNEVLNGEIGYLQSHDGELRLAPSTRRLENLGRPPSPISFEVHEEAERSPNHISPYAQFSTSMTTSRSSNCWLLIMGSLVFLLLRRP